MEPKFAPSAAKALPKASDLTAENFGALVDASVGRLVEQTWQEEDSSGTHMFVAPDGLRLPFMCSEKGKMHSRCKLARYLGRHGAVEPMPDDPNLHSLAWLADQPDLETADGREKAVELIRQVPAELAKRQQARAATETLSTAELERLLRQRRKGY